MSKFASHDDYIKHAAEPLQPSLVTLRDQLRSSLPDAEEIIAYDMPGFNIGDATIVGYAAFSKQCGIYLSSEAITSLSDEIVAAGLKHTKTGVTFTPNKPIPASLVKKLVLASRKSLGV